MTRIRKISFYCAWIGELIFLPLPQTVWLVSVSQQGWPAKRISEIVQEDQGFVITLIFKAMIISNIPDYLSILIYAKMFLMAKQSVQPEIEMQNEEPYGGIWLGEDVLSQHEDNC